MYYNIYYQFNHKGIMQNIEKERALNKFKELFNSNKDQPDKIWEALLEYRRLLGENEHI